MTQDIPHVVTPLPILIPHNAVDLGALLVAQHHADSDT